MGYIVTTKMEVVGGDIVSTPIAFPDTESNTTTFATWQSWDAWVDSNKIVNGPEDITLPDTGGTVCHMGAFNFQTIDNIGITLIEEL